MNPRAILWLGLLVAWHGEPARIHALEPVPDKMVVLTFDDSVASHHSFVRPLLKHYGFGATFFITEGFSFRTNKQDYMTWEQIAELHRDGFEIGNHTRDHLGVSVRTLGQLREQMEAINTRCAEHGIPRPVSFGYPGNAIVPGALPILQELGIRFARRGGAPEHPYDDGRGFAYEPGADHPLLIPSAGDARPDWTLVDFKLAADQARDGRIAVLQFHGVPDREHPWVHTRPERFEEFMRYLHTNQFKGIALRDLVRYVDPEKTPANPLAIVEKRKAARQFAVAQTNDWPQWRGANHDGISLERDWFKPWATSGPKQLWKRNVGIGFSSMSVRVGRVFTMGNGNNVDTIWCLDAATGRVLWTNSYPCALDPKYYEGGPGATPTVDDDRVFTFSKKGHVLCLEATSGQTIWSRNIADELSLKLPEWSFAGSALIEGDLVILNAGSAGTALDKRTGRIVWSSSPEPAGYATPIPFGVNGQRAVVIFSAKALLAVDPRTGRKLWEFPWETGRDVNAADPIVRGDKIFVSSSTGSALLQVRSNQVTAVWNKPNFMRNYFNPSVLLGDFLYGIDGTTHRPTTLACVDFDMGELKWSQPNFGSGALMAADNKLIILDKGELIIADATPEKYRERARAQVLGGKCWTVPVLSRGRVFCRNAAGDLVCVQVKE